MAVIDGKGGPDWDEQAGRLFAFCKDDPDQARDILARVHRLMCLRQAWIGCVEQSEPVVLEDPVVVPVVVVKPMLADVLTGRGIFRARVGSRQRAQVVEAFEELDLVEPPVPRSGSSPHSVEDVAAGDRRDPSGRVALPNPYALAEAVHGSRMDQTTDKRDGYGGNRTRGNRTTIATTMQLPRSTPDFIQFGALGPVITHLLTSGEQVRCPLGESAPNVR